MKVMMLFICLSLNASTVEAEPLYIEQFNNTGIDEQKLQETREQINDHTEVIIREDIFVAPFHKQNAKTRTDKQSFCLNCHQPQPHRADERKRSFLNMHSRYISCETCHFKPENIQLEYRWLDFNVEATTDNNKAAATRITPFYKNEAVIIFTDHELTKQVKETWTDNPADNATLQKAKLKLRLHTPLSKKGPKCLTCHTNKAPLLDLSSLGYSKKETTKLQQHAIPRFFSRFNKEDQRLRMTDLLQ